MFLEPPKQFIYGQAYDTRTGDPQWLQPRGLSKWEAGGGKASGNQSAEHMSNTHQVLGKQSANKWPTGRNRKHCVRFLQPSPPPSPVPLLLLSTLQLVIACLPFYHPKPAFPYPVKVLTLDHSSGCKPYRGMADAFVQIFRSEVTTSPHTLPSPRPRPFMD